MDFFRFLDTNGDGTGTKDASVNGAITPQVFKILPQSGESRLRMSRMLVHIVDFGTFDSGAYGNGVVLTNGIDVGLYNTSDDSLALDLLDGYTIKTNVDWGRFCYDATPSSYGTGNESLGARWTFTKAGEYLDVTAERYFAVTINDDLTGLIEHTFEMQGLVVNS